MLKKFFVAMFLTVFALVSNNICSAAMPRSEMYLGGLTTKNSTYDETVRIYGEPTSVDSNRQYDYSCNYGNSIKLVFQGYSYGQNGGRLISMRINENNGWKTPSGIGVGSNVAKLLDLYGEPDYKESSAIKSVYSYCADMTYIKVKNATEPGVEMVFICNKESGKILEIILTSSSWGMERFSTAHPKWLKTLAE